MVRLMKKKFLLIFCLFLVALAAAACGADEADLSINDDATILIHGLMPEDFEISMAELKEYEIVTESAVATRYNGEEIKVKITGALLNTLLADYGYKQTDFKTIRFYGNDGYAIALDSNVLQNDDIIIGYYDGGKPIDAENGPFRSVVPGERAMYWVRMLYQIDFENGEGAENVEKVIFVDEAANVIGTSDYNGTTDQAIAAKSLVDKYAAAETAERVFMLAADGLQKDELAANFLPAYLKLSGEHAPMFTAPNLPEGMNVNEFIVIHYGKTAFFSLQSALNSLSLTGYDEYEGVAFSDILKKVGSMGADSYLFTAADGNTAVYEFTELSNSLFFLNDEGQVVFVPGVADDAPLVGVISIEPLK